MLAQLPCLIRRIRNESFFRFTYPNPLYRVSLSPTSDGSAAAVLCSLDFVKKHNLQDKAVLIVGMEMATDFPSTFKEGSCMKMVKRERDL